MQTLRAMAEKASGRRLSRGGSLRVGRAVGSARAFGSPPGPSSKSAKAGFGTAPQPLLGTDATRG